MDLELAAHEPNPLGPGIILVVVGLVGFLTIRRWPTSILIIAPLVLFFAWRVLEESYYLLDALRQPGLWIQMWRDVVIIGLILILGLGPPALAWRQRSRPAV